jgi:hypothetical protein
MDVAATAAFAFLSAPAGARLDCHGASRLAMTGVVALGEIR